MINKTKKLHLRLTGWDLQISNVLNKLRRLISPPIFPGNERNSQRARLLYTTTWAIIIMGLLVMVGNWLGGKVPAILNWLNMFFVLALLGTLILVRREQIEGAGIGVLVIGFTHITIGVALLGTIRTPTTAAYITIVIMAGLVFERKGLIISTVACSLSILGFVYAENAGWLPPANFSVTITQWITYTVLIGFNANIILTATQMSNRYLKRAHKELAKRRETEKGLRIFSRAFEQSPTSIVITNTDGKILNVNPKFTQITGFTQSEAHGQNPKVLKSGEHSEEFYATLWKTILSGKVWEGMFHNKKKNGDLYWEQASIAPVLDDTGVVTHFVAIKEDITARREAEAELRDANKMLKKQLAQIEELQTELHEQAMRDPLTGLYNRRYMDEMAFREFSRAKREGYPVSVIMIDLDSLKGINDAGGHPTGDHALRKLASHLKDHTRPNDTVCRLGGDEFAVIMPNTHPLDAYQRAEEWRKKISEITLLHREGEVLRITFTAGISTYPAHGETIEDIINFADVALYRAKVNGRNRVELFTQ
jgi:diguanylate cyclase (GGDEF)-like protein/PAS domain S-box-containing protein